MKLQQSEVSWLDSRATVTLSELSRACRMSTAELDELVDYGALVPLELSREEALFSADRIATLRTAGKLRLNFDLDLFTVAMLVGYLDRIEALERQLRTLQAHLPAHVLRGQRAGRQPWRETRGLRQDERETHHRSSRGSHA